MRYLFFFAVLISSPGWSQDEIGEFEEFEPEKPTSDIRYFGRFDPSFATDTRYDSSASGVGAENVLDSRFRAQIGVESSFSKKGKIWLEAWAKWRGTSQRNFERAKGTVDVRLGEAYVDFYGASMDFRIGNQRVAFGANPLLAPADAFNPIDFSEVSFLGAPEYARLPVLGVKASGSWKGFDWTAVVTPFFQSHRFSLFGQDEGLVQPGLQLQVPLTVDPTIEDELQQRLVETQRPVFGDVGFRTKTKINNLSVGASWVWMNEKIPYLELDGQLTSLLFQVGRGEVDPQTASSVQARVLSGENLYQARYARRHLFSLEASRLISSAQLDVDVSWSPRQVFIDSRLRPSFKNSLTWLVGLSQAEDAPFFYSLHYLGMWIADVDSKWPLFLIEKDQSAGQTRQVFLGVLAGHVSYQLWNKKIEVSLSFVVEPLYGSFVASPRATWRVSDKTNVWLGFEAFEGPPLSAFGYFGRNDQLAAGAQVLFF